MFIPKGENGPPEGEVPVVEFCNALITLRLISALNADFELNDEIVNCYFNLLQARDKLLCENNVGRRASHFFSSSLLNKLMNDGSKGPNGQKYDFDNVKRYY